MDSMTKATGQVSKISMVNKNLNTLRNALINLEITTSNIKGEPANDEVETKQELSPAELFTTGQSFLQSLTDRISKVDETLKEIFF